MTTSTTRWSRGATAGVLLALAVLVLAGCSGTIPVPVVDCRLLGCPAGQACVADAGGGYQCISVTPPPPPPPPPDPCQPNPCDPAETCLPLATGAECRPPAPVCHEGETCGCWHRPPGQPWTKLPDCPAPPPPPPPPPPTGCSIDGEPGPPIPDYKVALGTQVNQAMLVLHPECSIGGRCVILEGRQEWQAKVVAKLRATWGLCAGQHAPDTDEIAVATSATAPREGWHVYAGPWDGPGTIVWAPQAARGAYAAPSSPPSGGCSDPLPPPLARFGSHPLASRPGVRKFTSTPLVRGAAYCAQIGLAPRDECPVRAECDPTKDNLKCGERSACEALAVGLPGPPAKPVWTFTGRGLYVYEDNPYNAEIPEAEPGTLTVCNAVETVCTVVRP